ncbi:MAG: hypothetical protein DME00_33965 [Candidatus Rokuibacteriota bacterium]|nr:MAG: hypothetical protein DME00_33965 [Candidatus Rokubacteria bacterium]
MVPRFASTISFRSTALGSIQANGITVVPEPTTPVLLVAGLAMIGGLALRSPQTRDTAARRYGGTKL